LVPGASDTLISSFFSSYALLSSLPLVVKVDSAFFDFFSSFLECFMGASF